MLITKCTQCNIEFKPNIQSKGLFCGFRCYWDSLKDKKPRINNKGKISWNKGIKLPEQSGINHFAFKENRFFVTTRTARKLWTKNVLERDKHQCKIANKDCKGRTETHHILNFMDYPELRYQINNGITLCHAHHPRGRAEEKRMVSVFTELLTVSNSIILQ